MQRLLRSARAHRPVTALVSAAIQQQSANFEYSDVEQGHTVFKIRASHATQFKDQNRALLQDVWITIYGKAEDRDDNIHTRECSYQPLTGAIRCAGEVQIDLQGRNPASGKATDQSLEVMTSDLSFNRETGEASTTQPVKFRFNAGHGQGVGILYRAHESTLRVEHNVDFELNPQQKNGVPVTATGNSLEIRRDDRLVILDGPATLRQGTRELTAQRVSIVLDQNYKAQRAIAEGHPQVSSHDGSDKVIVAGAKFAADLSPEAWIEHIATDGPLTAMREEPTGTQRLSTDHAEIEMLPRGNLIKEMKLTGRVIAGSNEGDTSNIIKTDSMHIRFGEPNVTNSQAKEPMARQSIESLETLSRGTIESKSHGETTNLGAERLEAKLNTAGRVDQLWGHSGVKVSRQNGSDAVQTSTASELIAKFGTDGDWDTIDETGNVRISQGDEQATAAHAHLDRSTGLAILEGKPVISDSISRTSTMRVEINQQTGDIHASGGVVSDYLANDQNHEIAFGSGSAHVSADSLIGSTGAGHFIYSGHARLWQGQSVLEGEQIEYWRNEQKLQAKGQVLGIFPQAAGPVGAGQMHAGQKSTTRASSSKTNQGGATLWTVRAPLLTYWNGEAKVRLEGGVTAASTQGSLQSKTLDVYLNGPGATNGPAEQQSTSRNSEDSGQLNRLVATGDVVVQQGDRRGMAEQAEYTSADQKFVLSGGKPTITDASSDTTTGRSLTFFVADDTILVDSQEGSRTLTRHRVEK